MLSRASIVRKELRDEYGLFALNVAKKGMLIEVSYYINNNSINYIGIERGRQSLICPFKCGGYKVFVRNLADVN